MSLGSTRKVDRKNLNIRKLNKMCQLTIWSIINFSIICRTRELSPICVMFDQRIVVIDFKVWQSGKLIFLNSPSHSPIYLLSPSIFFPLQRIHHTFSTCISWFPSSFKVIDSISPTSHSSYSISLPLFITPTKTSKTHNTHKAKGHPYRTQLEPSPSTPIIEPHENHKDVIIFIFKQTYKDHKQIQFIQKPIDIKT